MKLTFSFQTLIMSVLATVLALATAFWALAVYDSIYRIILRGFDQTLHALAGGAAVFTDGDAHADYQRPHRISAICGGADGVWGFDEERGLFVVIDTEAGGALPLDIRPDLPPQPIAELACDIGAGRILALDAAGGLHWLLGDPLPLREGLPPLAEILHADGAWWGRSGSRLEPLLAAPAALVPTTKGAAAPAAIAAADAGPLLPTPAAQPPRQLAASMDRLAFDAGTGRFIGIGIEAGEVVVLGADGSLLDRFPIDLDGQHVQGLVVQGSRAYLASRALLSVDLEDKSLVAEPPSPGYYSEAHPFIARYLPAYQQVRASAGLTFLYTEQLLGGDQLRYILDGSEGDAHTAPGYEDTIPEDTLDEMLAAQQQGRGFVSDIRQWEVWGLIKVAAEPIFGSDGRVVALAGADVNIGVIRGKTRIALFAVLGVGVGLLLLAAWVSLRVSRGLTRPLREIKDGALRIAAGYFDRPPQARGRDEIAGLAQSLSRLGERLQSQARQSRVYQQTLISGRMQLALEHALRDECAMAASNLPFRPTRDPVGGAAAAGEPAAGSLFWQRDGQAEGLESAREQARTLQLARALLRRHDLGAAQDALFAADPSLDCVLAWQPRQRTLRVRCRAPMRIERIERDGRAAPLNLADGIQLQLSDCAGLRLPAGWRLSLEPQAEESGA